MDAHSTTPTTPVSEEHAHPARATYVKIGLFLFVLTALEVAAYEISDHPGGGFGAVIASAFVPVLLALSAAKFALVAMFYMHLKQDSKLFSGVFVFPLLIAGVVIISLMILFAYHYTYQG